MAVGRRGMNNRAECDRHFPFVPDPTPGTTGYPMFPYHTVRCTHLGNRFVVETANQASGWRFVDYVETLPDGEVVVETGEWEALVAQMERGEPPMPER